MMRKAGILMVIALLAVTGIMGAMAFTSAEVTSDAELRITSTNNSLIRFDTYNDGTKPNETDYTVGIKNGELWFDFTQGTAPVNKEGFGFQPNSVYVYEELFRVLNMQKNVDKVALTVETDLPYIYMYDRKGNYLLKDGVTQDPVITGGDRITVEFRIPSGADLTAWNSRIAGEIVFHAESVVE